VPWLKRLVAGISPRRPGFDPGSVHVGFVLDKVTLGQVFPRVLRFSLVTLIPPVLHYTEKLIIFITGLHNKPQGCGASVASAAGPFIKKSSDRTLWMGDRTIWSSSAGCSWCYSLTGALASCVVDIPKSSTKLLKDVRLSMRLINHLIIVITWSGILKGRTYIEGGWERVAEENIWI
jgi:hypothetical protein